MKTHPHPSYPPWRTILLNSTQHFLEAIREGVPEEVIHTCKNYLAKQANHLQEMAQHTEQASDPAPYQKTASVIDAMQKALQS